MDVVEPETFFPLLRGEILFSGVEPLKFFLLLP